MKKNITIVSAHKGSRAWEEVMNEIGESSFFNVDYFYEFDDEYYRFPHGFISRFVLRVRTFIIFPLRFLLFWSRLKSKSDTFIFITSPFYLPLIVCFFRLGSSIPKILLMNDIYPEALVIKKIIRRNSALERFIKGLFQYSLKYFNYVVFISKSHRSYFDQLNCNKSVVIPVSGNARPFRDIRIDFNIDSLRYVYCGTLGLMHDTETFLSWLNMGSLISGKKFSFYTSGSSKITFESRVEAILKKREIGCVHLGDALPHEAWVVEMISSQIGLVFQSKGSGAVIFPSKVASNLAAGQAIIAVTERNTELAQLILDYDCGWVVEPGNIEDFANAVRMAQSPTDLYIKRNNSLLLSRSMFSEPIIAKQWLCLINSL